MILTARTPDGAPLSSTVNTVIAFKDSRGAMLESVERDIEVADGRAEVGFTPVDETFFIELTASAIRDGYRTNASVTIGTAHSGDQNYLSVARSDAEAPASVGERVDLSGGYHIVMQHPVTTEYDEALRQVQETLYAVKELDLPTLWFWPNPDAGSDGTSKGIRMFREREHPTRIHLFRNMAPEDFLRLLVHSNGIIGNSSVAIRECSYLGVPAVNIGTRQQGREHGANVTNVDHDRHAIVEAVRRQLSGGRPARDTMYGDGQAGGRIAACLAERHLGIEKRLTY